MKKYLIVLILLFSCLLISCKEKENDNEDDEKEIEYYTPELINATHKFNLLDDELNHYLVIKSFPDDENELSLDTLLYQLIIYTNFPRNYNDGENDYVLTERYYDYFQCDYYTSNEHFTYYKDYVGTNESSSLANAERFMPRFQTTDRITKFDVLYKYQFVKAGEKINKELSFSENILEFDITKFNSYNPRYSFKLHIESKEEESYNRYRLEINLDDSKISGHYDIQTWIECDGMIVPFIGYYHYKTVNGNIYTGTDEKISKNRNITKIYYMVNYYDYSGNIESIYYVEELS